jgi:WD40 repeat protein
MSVVKPVFAWNLQQPPKGICFSPQGEVLHAYDGKIIYSWNVPEFQYRQHFEVTESEQSGGGHCHFLNHGKSIMLISSKSNTEEGIHHLTIRDLEDYSLQHAADIRFDVYGLFDIRLNQAEDKLLLRDYSNTSHLLEFPSCKIIHSINYKDSKSGTMIFSPDESQIWAVCGYDEPSGYKQYLTAFDLATGTKIRQQPPHAGNHIDRIRVVPHEKALLALEEESICLHDPTTWELQQKIDLSEYLNEAWGRSSPAIAFNAKHSVVAASCHYNEKICIAKIDPAQLLGVFEIFCTKLLSFSPDGRYLALASYDVDKQVQVWDLSPLLAE